MQIADVNEPMPAAGTAAQILMGGPCEDAVLGHRATPLFDRPTLYTASPLSTTTCILLYLIHYALAHWLTANCCCGQCEGVQVNVLQGDCPPRASAAPRGPGRLRLVDVSFEGHFGGRRLPRLRSLPFH
eukprot:scaffold29429_cov30-Tisochrysis_lutea.AAC.6